MMMRLIDCCRLYPLVPDNNNQVSESCSKQKVGSHTSSKLAMEYYLAVDTAVNNPDLSETKRRSLGAARPRRFAADRAKASDDLVWPVKRRTLVTSFTDTCLSGNRRIFSDNSEPTDKLSCTERSLTRRQFPKSSVDLHRTRIIEFDRLTGLINSQRALPSFSFCHHYDTDSNPLLFRLLHDESLNHAWVESLSVVQLQFCGTILFETVSIPPSDNRTILRAPIQIPFAFVL